MNSFKVFVRPVGAGVPVPPLFSNAAVAGSPIRKAFDTGAGGRISLEIDRSFLTSAYATATVGQRVSSYWLHKATRDTLNNPSDGKVSRIALLLANEYTYAPALGVMFDRGFATDDDPASVADDPELVGRPREACAVFLGAIGGLRHGAPPRDFDQEVLFNCVHELGHVFNLQHRFDGPNFLSNSPPKGKLPDNYERRYLHFIKSHSDLLQEDPLPSTTWPGGSEFADTGLHGDKDVARPRRRARRRFGLDLRIGLRRHSIVYFDPLELDVELRVLPGVARHFRLLDEIDPGYESFRVWIERPDGERCLYRCPRHYCRPQRTLMITPTRPFCRDISIFGQSGGYTFRHAGVHRLWVEFDARSDPPLRSNVLELEIVPIGKIDRAARECRALFTSRPGKVLLYHRIDDIGGYATRDFLAFAERFPRSPLAVEALYATVRARDVGTSSVRGEERESIVRDTVSILQRLADEALLSEHKRSKCLSLLQAI